MNSFAGGLIKKGLDVVAPITKINMVKNYFGFIFVILLLSVSPSFAAVLHWSPVESTENCVIAGYKIHYGTISGDYSQVVNVGDATAYDLDLLGLVPTQTYFFAVNAYSTTNQDGPLSSPVAYRDSPNIVAYPSIDHGDNTIDVTFNESNMLGADVKNNYEFSPTILFNAALEIVRTDRTYRLSMQYIPEYTILTMKVSGITDNNLHALISDSIVLNDDDNDGMADDWESHYGISSAFLDSDSDGLYNQLEYTIGTSPVDGDSDDDGMDDAWEVQNGLNPVLDDADGDIDGDGITNFAEYSGGTSVSNKTPEKPVLNLPVTAATNVSLNPQISTNDYVDNENDAHEKTQWQISTESTFTVSENIVYELESYESLTVLTIPEFILDTGETYYWRVRFFDVLNVGSLWSDPFSFSTMADNPEDPDGNGVPDIQQVTDGTIDLNDDGYFDVSSSTYKMVASNGISLGLEASNNVTAVDFLKCIDPDDISDTFDKPDDLDFGLIQFKIRVANMGDAAEVKIYFSEPVGTSWYKYDLINGWAEYSMDYPANVQFASDNKSVLLRLVDGGPGDSDGVANGIIVDPSGPGSSASVATSSSGGDESSGGGGGGGGGCFIATAAFGSPMGKHIEILRDFRDIYLLNSWLGIEFVKAYYRYTPPVADVIARHVFLRTVVRIGLMPIIVFGYIVVYTSFFEQCVILFLLVGMALMAGTRLKNFKSVFS